VIKKKRLLLLLRRGVFRFYEVSLEECSDEAVDIVLGEVPKADSGVHGKIGEDPQRLSLFLEAQLEIGVGEH
jgi:hypothetical protein